MSDHTKPKQIQPVVTDLYRIVTFKDSVFRWNTQTGKTWILTNHSLQWNELKEA